MGCGAGQRKTERVTHPAARTLAQGSQAGTTHMTCASDNQIKGKVPRPLVISCDMSDKSVEITGPPREKQGESQVISPRSAASFNVICWCRDQAILAQINQDPTLEYTPEDSTQTLVFNRFSALSPLTSDLRITAIVYLISEASDLEVVGEVAKNFDRVWNHFIVGPVGLKVQGMDMPALTEKDNLMKAIHEAYLDLITVVDGFLVSAKEATIQSLSLSVHNALTELLDIAGGRDTSYTIGPLRKHWRHCRYALWSIKRFFRSLPSRILSLSSLSTLLSPSNGELKVQIGALSSEIRSKVRFCLSTSDLPVPPSAEFTTCWLSIGLRPRQGVDPSLLSLLADKTKEALKPQEDFFGSQIG